MTTSIAPQTVEEIVDGLRDHVWTLVRAGQVDAAMHLLASRIPDYLRIVGTEPRYCSGDVQAGVTVEVIDVVTWSIPVQVFPAELLAGTPIE